MTDHYSDEEFAPIAAALKELPYFEPSPRFADKVMARVHIQGAVGVPSRAVEVRTVRPAYMDPIERRAYAPVPHTDMRRSIPARLVATAMVASVGITMTMVALVAMFDLNIFVLISRVFGESTIAFLSGLAADASASVAATATGSAAAAGTAAGAAVIGSFAAGAVAATAALRAAASASRKAA